MWFVLIKMRVVSISLNYNEQQTQTNLKEYNK